MNSGAWALLLVYMAVVLALSWPLGIWLTAIGEGRVPRAFRPVRWLENGFYRASGIDPESGMTWPRYARSLLVFNALGVLFVYLLQRIQGLLPLNPAGMANVRPDSAFNTAISFVTNTNWQGYGGESTMGYLVQMLALTVQNFVSAATGIAVAFALIRGFALRSSASIGNFWADLTRTTLYVLLPISFAFALYLCSQGVIQNFDGYREVVTVEGATQVLAQGPVASQEAIKMLGTNGGGFMNANSAHPYENPTPWTNFWQMVSIFVIPAGLCFTFGRMVKDRRQGWALLGAMSVLFLVTALLPMSMEQRGNPELVPLGVDAVSSEVQSGGNMEGKEVRFGIAASALFATITTSASCGAVNSMHDSFLPLGGLAPLWLMQIGEVVFGGVGAGLYGMLVFAILSVFIAGLMIGRTPEYLGKKIEAFEMRMVSAVILATPFVVLGGTALAVLTEAGRAGISNPGPHGLSQVLYAFSSAGNNNGSAFAGLSANTPFYNILLAAAMWIGRFVTIVALLAVAGSLAAKTKLDPTNGTMPTHGPLFVGLLVGTVVLIGALTYFPALALGPIVEHLQLFGRTTALGGSAS